MPLGLVLVIVLALRSLQALAALRALAPPPVLRLAGPVGVDRRAPSDPTILDIIR